MIAEIFIFSLSLKQRQDYSSGRMSSTEMDAKGSALFPTGIGYKPDLNEGDLLAIGQFGDGTIIIKRLARRLHTELEERNIRE